jgi:hypothetical protein
MYQYAAFRADEEVEEQKDQTTDWQIGKYEMK